MKGKSELIAGLDVGTSTVRAIIGKLNRNGLDIVGFGASPSFGVKAGRVVNRDMVVDSITQAVNEAWSTAGQEVKNFIVGINGGRFDHFSVHAYQRIRGNEVSIDDLRNVMKSARMLAVPDGRKILHAIPQEYILDNYEGIWDPLERRGDNLEARVYAVTCSCRVAINLTTCAETAGLEVESLVLKPMAASLAVITDEEKNGGTVVIDMGAGTTGILILQDGVIVHSSALSMGGNRVTVSISQMAVIGRAEAEKLKIGHGSAKYSLAAEDDQIALPPAGSPGPRTITRRELYGIIDDETTQIIHFVRNEIEHSGYGSSIDRGVITGGMSRMDGMSELVSEVLGISIRKGKPSGFGGIYDVASPACSTIVGLVMVSRLLQKPFYLPWDLNKTMDKWSL